MKPRIGVLTSGGDCPGLNAVLRAVVLAADKLGIPRCCVLGHLQRGGAPTTLDRILATRFGVKAVQLANEGHFGSMVSYQNYQVRHVSIAEAVNRLKLVPPNGELVQTARDVDISFGD